MIWRKNWRSIASTKMKWELLCQKQNVKMYSITTIQMLSSFWWVVRCLQFARWKLQCASNPGSKRLNSGHGIAWSVKYANSLQSKSRNHGGTTWRLEFGLIWSGINSDWRQLYCSRRCEDMRYESATGTTLACTGWRGASNSSVKCNRTYRKAPFCTLFDTCDVMRRNESKSVASKKSKTKKRQRKTRAKRRSATRPTLIRILPPANEAQLARRTSKRLKSQLHLLCRLKERLLTVVLLVKMQMVPTLKRCRRTPVLFLTKCCKTWTWKRMVLRVASLKIVSIRWSQMPVWIKNRKLSKRQQKNQSNKMRVFNRLLK